MGASAGHPVSTGRWCRRQPRCKGMAALVKQPETVVPSPAQPRAPAALPTAIDTSSRPGAALVQRLLPGFQAALAVLVALGAGVFVASLLVGRSALFWPS